MYQPSFKEWYFNNVVWDPAALRSNARRTLAALLENEITATEDTKNKYRYFMNV